MRKRTLRIIATTFLFLGASFVYVSAWTGPTQSPPGGNVAAPLNVGSGAQSKNGYLGVNEVSNPTFPFEVNGSSLLSGSVVLNGQNLYLNFGGTGGSGGYGIRDSGGMMQYKNSGGGWANIGGGSFTGPYLPTYASWSSSGAGDGGAAIYNDNNSFNSLMIVGNTASGLDGGLRQVHVWDDLTVNNNLTVQGTTTAKRYCIGSSCITSWPSGSQWTTAGANIYYTGGDVGVDNSNPTEPLDVTGIIRSNSDIISSGISGDGANIRMIGGSYGSFFRNDGVNTYFLLTASGSQYGTWNALRPFTVNDSTGKVTMSNGVTATGGVTADVVTAPQYCIGTSCITSWPSGGSGTVGGSGTTNYIPRWTSTTALGNSTISDDGTSATANGNFFMGQSGYVSGQLFVQNTLNLSGNQLWTNSGTLYLNYANTGGNIELGNPTNSKLPAKENDIYANGRLGLEGYSPNSGYPSGWFGGLHTGDVYAEGTVGAGTGGSLNAWINSTGNEYIGGALNVQNAMNLNGNQLWTNSGTLYLNYSNSGGAVQIGQPANNNNSLDVYGKIGEGGYSADSGYPSGWTGGIHAFDVYAEGTVGAGIGGSLNSWISDNGYGYFSNNLQVGGDEAVTGNVTAGSFLYSSDERLKKDIQPLGGNLAKILAIQPVSYYWIDPLRGTGPQIGFIAQQVRSIVPQLVHEDASTTLLSVDYARVAPLLVGSVQELNQKIADQQTQIDSQQAEISQLQVEIQALESK